MHPTYSKQSPEDQARHRDVIRNHYALRDVDPPADQDFDSHGRLSTSYQDQAARQQDTLNQIAALLKRAA